ncbi:MAG: hypothetical protein LAO77_19795 [Acidobacteriia bacterium]|nr:hypothetical protein [Terriglobia bacterium]
MTTSEDGLDVPTREELLGPDADDSDWVSLDVVYSWLHVEPARAEPQPSPIDDVDDDVTAQIVPFDPTLSTAGVTEFFHPERWGSDSATVVPIVPIAQIDETSPLRTFVDQFDRFAADFHAFAIECQERRRP